MHLEQVLADFGLDPPPVEALLKGEEVEFDFRPRPQVEACGVLLLDPPRLRVMVFYVKSEATRQGVAALLDLRRLALDLAKSSAVTTLELIGLSLINERVKAFLLNNGGIEGTIAAPDALGDDGDTDCVTITIELEGPS